MPVIDGIDMLVNAVLRAGAVFTVLSITGIVIFRGFVLARMPDQQAVLALPLRRLMQCSWGLALVLHAGWLWSETARMADVHGVSAIFAALPVVVAQTRFGHLIAAQIMMLSILALVAGRRTGLALIPAVACLALQVGHSHAASMHPISFMLLAVDFLHLAAAAGWLGGLPPLLLAVACCTPSGGALAARWFSPTGKICVVVLGNSALVQGWIVIASLHGLLETDYGWMALAKAGLLMVLLMFAVLNRYRLAPALRGDQPEASRRVLLCSVALQTMVGVVVVIAAALLSSLPPPMMASMAAPDMAM